MKNFISILYLVFVSFNVFGQNPRVEGYKGIWFTLGQFSEYGDKYSGGLGTYTADHIPIAIYSPQSKKTFFTYGGTTGADQRHLLIMISYYDHETGKVPKPVIVYDKNGVDDPHDNAALSIDTDGYIWVFVSGRSRSRPGFIFRSENPYSIDSFEKIKEGEMTYPQPWWIKGKGFLYLFTKYTNGRELYWSTSPDGRTWTPDQKLAGLGGHYQVTNMLGNKLISVFNYHPGGNVDKRTNIYAVMTEDLGKTWKNIGGRILKTPLGNTQNEALIRDYESEKKLVYINDLNFDDDGNPVILAVISNDFRPGPAGDPREWTIIHWKNGKWNFSKVCNSTHNYDMGSLYIVGGKWTIVGPTEPGPQYYGAGGEIAAWVSSDEGKTWQKAGMLTAGSPRNHSYVRRPLHPEDPFYNFWADGDADKLSESHLYFSDKKGTVRELPYEMKEDFATPSVYKKSAADAINTTPGHHGISEYFAAPEDRLSTDLSVKINGKDVKTVRFQTYDYTHFAATGAFQVMLTSKTTIDKITVSPGRFGIKAVAGKAVSSFVLPGPGYYAVRINGTQKLFIFADNFTDVPGDTVNVKLFTGTLNPGEVITDKIQAAIDKVSGTGKTLFFPAGIYTTGSLSIPSNSKIWLADGALIKGAQDLRLFTFNDSIKPKSFIRIKDAANVSIKGRGTIDANGRILRDKYADDARMRLFLILNSKDITIEGITVRDPGSWNTHVLYSDNVTIRNIKMLNDIELSNTDGFDPDASRNVLIEKCFAYCSDDNVAVKATGNSGFLRDVENVTVKGCVFLTKKSSLKVGTESRASVMRNILFENNDVVECDRGMSLYCSDGASFENISYIGNRFEDCYPDSKQSFMNFTITKRNPDSKAGSMKDILVKDCHFSGSFPKNSEISGFDQEHTINVTFSGMNIAGKACNTIADADIRKNLYANIFFR
ncbi:MAG TPA: glycosyl hydrolase family 28 protein [Bacteroidales bacterium]|nr:glycosyl hydrolase family 28 protein [Bacteroidales bacterium]